MRASEVTRLLRHLRGEGTAEERAALEMRLRREPELAAERARLATTWEGLELPPPSGVPPGFAGAVLSRLRQPPAPPPLFAGAWMRAAGLAALLAGVALGGLLAERASTSSEETLAWEQTSLAEEYLAAEGADEAASTAAREAQ